MVFGDGIPRPDSAEEGRHMSNLPSCQVNITPKKRSSQLKMLRIKAWKGATQIHKSRLLIFLRFSTFDIKTQYQITGPPGGSPEQSR